MRYEFYIPPYIPRDFSFSFDFYMRTLTYFSMTTFTIFTSSYCPFDGAHYHMYFDVNYLRFILPEASLIVCVFILIVFNIFFKNFFYSKDLVNINISICLFVLFYTLYATIFFYDSVVFIENGFFKTTIFLSYAKAIAILLVILNFLISFNYFKNEKFQFFEYPLLIILSLIGMLFLITSYDLFTIYLVIELQSFCFYVLAGLKKYSNLSIEASLKYFIFGSFASVIMLFGISLIYGFFGTISLQEIYFFATEDALISFEQYGVFIGLLFISLGLFFKLGLFPFHF